VPGYEAPVYIAWSAKNRSPLIRIPAARGASTRVELRCPDPAANPYLTLAVCLAAGLDGIKNKLIPQDSVDKNIFNMTQEEKDEIGIMSLPESLEDSIIALENNDLIKNVLGIETTKKYVKAKREEWDQYSIQISQWEIDQYLHRI
jgi:glutamine synthetase